MWDFIKREIQLSERQFVHNILMMLHLPIVLTLAAAASAQSYVGCYHHEYNTMLLTDNMMWFGNEWAGLLTPDL